MPYRQPAERPPEPRSLPPVVATHEAEPVVDEPSTMWVSDAKGRAIWDRERKKLLATRMVYAAIIVVVILVFVVELRPR